jgi:hypothetical protein
MRYFTVQEAEALIPELEKIFSNVLNIHAQAEAKARKLAELQSRGQTASEQVLERAQLQFLINGMNEWLNKILDLGAFPKGIDPALVDFPYRLEGYEVHLCWKFGEKEITHYHGLEEGFAGRKTLPRKTHSA